jgi:hypothetical protein
MTCSAKQSIEQQKESMDCFVAEPVIGPAERPDPLAPLRKRFAFVVRPTSFNSA